MKRKIRVFSLFTFLGLVAIMLLLGALAWAQKKPPKPPQPPADPAIAYSVSGPVRYDLMVMNADGSNQRVVVSEKMVDNVNPDWSPDGKQLVFTRFCRKGGCNGIYIVNVEGSGLTKVVDFNWQGSCISRPAWSPVPLGDGKYKIVFSDRKKYADGTFKTDDDLFMVSLDGLDLVQLTNTAGVHEWNVDWSPLGDRVVVETYEPATGKGDIVVYKINYDETNFSAIPLGSVIPEDSPLADSIENLLDDWAKTQDKLLVTAGSPGPTFSGEQFDLWTIDVNTYEQVRLTSTLDQSEYGAQWSPDDSKIVFSKGGYFWVMNSDGSGAKQIVSPSGVWCGVISWRRNL